MIRTLQGAGGRFTEEQAMFFESAGVPGPLLEHLSGLIDPFAIKLYSCLIAYSDATPEDKQFANALYDALKANGVSCWMYERDALIGRHPWEQIDVAMRNYDKVIVVCSKSSLQRPGVQREIDRALSREDDLVKLKARIAEEARAEAHPVPALDTDVLFPVRIDDAIFSWEHARRPDILNAHHIGDFTGWKDSTRFEKALDGLLRALDPRSWPSQEDRKGAAGRPR